MTETNEQPHNLTIKKRHVLTWKTELRAILEETRTAENGEIITNGRALLEKLLDATINKGDISTIIKLFQWIEPASLSDNSVDPAQRAREAFQMIAEIEAFGAPPVFQPDTDETEDAEDTTETAIESESLTDE